MGSAGAPTLTRAKYRYKRNRLQHHFHGDDFDHATVSPAAPISAFNTVLVTERDPTLGCVSDYPRFGDGHNTGWREMGVEKEMVGSRILSTGFI